MLCKDVDWLHLNTGIESFENAKELACCWKYKVFVYSCFCKVEPPNHIRHLSDCLETMRYTCSAKFPHFVVGIKE